MPSGADTRLWFESEMQVMGSVAMWQILTLCPTRPEWSDLINAVTHAGNVRGAVLRYSLEH